MADGQSNTRIFKSISIDTRKEKEYEESLSTLGIKENERGTIVQFPFHFLATKVIVRRMDFHSIAFPKTQGGKSVNTYPNAHTHGHALEKMEKIRRRVLYSKVKYPGRNNFLSLKPI
jgi:hypothetical protein